MDVPPDSTNDFEREQRLQESKEAEFYSQSVAAWFSSRLEHDKSLLTLSTAGVGVLVTMVQSAIDSISSLLLYIFAILSFVISLVSVLFIFKMNTTHIEGVINKIERENRLLLILDSVASFSFFLGMLLSAILGMAVAISTLHDKEAKMAEKNQNKSVQMQNAFDSVHGLANLQPVATKTATATDMTKSFQGMTQLQGQNKPMTQSQSQPTQAQSGTQKK